MDIILDRARKVVIDDERDLRNVGEGPAERIVDDEHLLASSRAIVARAELGHDGVAGGLAYVLVLWNENKSDRVPKRVSKPSGRTRASVSMARVPSL
jgi:hypothetical protein